MEDEKFECVYNKYKNLVMDTAYEVLKDYYLAQDVCQEVFIKLPEERMILLDSPGEMKRYLRAVAYHRAIDHYRMIKRRSEVSLYTEENLIMDLDVDEKMDTDTFTMVLFRDLEEKKPEWHYIIIHLGLYDEPAEKVARDMGISIELLRVKYHRAKKWICKNYGSEYYYLKEK